MDFIKRFFPTSLKANNLKGFLATLIIYVVVNFVGGLVLGLLGKLPLIGFIASFAGWLLGGYCAIGAILAILVFLGLVK